MLSSSRSTVTLPPASTVVAMRDDGGITEDTYTHVICDHVREPDTLICLALGHRHRLMLEELVSDGFGGWKAGPHTVGWVERPTPGAVLVGVVDTEAGREIWRDLPTGRLLGAHVGVRRRVCGVPARQERRLLALTRRGRAGARARRTADVRADPEIVAGARSAGLHV